MNALDYAETLARLLTVVEEHKGKLALSTTQHEGFKESLSDALRKINKAEYFQIKEERKEILSTQKTSTQETEETQEKLGLAKAGNTNTCVSNSFGTVLEEDKTALSYFSYPLSFVKEVGSLVKRGVNFAIENPTQFIINGIILNAAAVAVRSPFSSPQFNKIQKMGPRSNIIDLASLSSTQGFMIEGAIPRDQSGFSVSSAGDFNGDGVNDVIVGAWLASPLGRTQAGASYVIYGKKGRYPGPIDLARLNANQGVIIEGATAGDGSGGSVSSAGDFNGDGLSDVIVGAYHVSPKGRSQAGSSYVIYGNKSMNSVSSLSARNKKLKNNG